MSQTLRIIAIRHLLSKANLTTKSTGSRAYHLTVDDAEVPLERTPEALAMMDKFRQVFGDHYGDAGPMSIIRSPTCRTKETMEVALPALEPESFRIKIDPRLGEKRFGRWDGLDDAERKADDPLRFAAYTYNEMSPAQKMECDARFSRMRDRFPNTGKFWVGPPEGESIYDVQQRVQEALRELPVIGGRTGRNQFGLFMHSVSMSALIGILGNMKPEELMEAPRPLNGSIYEWNGSFDGERFIGEGRYVFAGFEVPVLDSPPNPHLLRQALARADDAPWPVTPAPLKICTA